MISTRRIFNTINKSSYLKQQLYFKPQNSFFWGKKKNVSQGDAQISENQVVGEKVEDIQNIVQQQQQTTIQQEQVIDLTQQAREQLEIKEEISEVSSNIQQGIDFKIDNQQYFSNTYVPEMDIGNIANSMAPLNQYQHISILDKLSYCSPYSIYEQLDVMSRDILFYISESSGLGWGLGLSIATCSLGIKLVFMPLMTFTQVNALKMKLIEPEMKNFQNQSQALQRRGDYKGLKEAQKQFANLRKSHGINNWITLLSLTQIPFLITWFISLRYVCSLPDQYPALKTEGLLWFQNLAEADPYFILPLISASLSYLNISMNPNLQNSSGGNIFSKYMRYFKFLPFATLPIVGFFPAGLNVYWAITAATHLAVGLAVRSKFMRYQVFKIPEYLPGTILERLNSKHTQKVIKTTIVEEVPSKKEAIDKIAMSLTGKPLPNKPNQQKSTQQQNKPKAEGVQVFANKPVKKKKKTA